MNSTTMISAGKTILKSLIKSNLTSKLPSACSFTFILVLLLNWNVGRGQATLFSDNFGVSTGGAYDNTGPIGTSTTWNLNRSGVDWGAKIDLGRLDLTNDASGTANVNGWVFGYRDINALAGWNTTLNNNTAIVIWEFNMRQIRTDPSGFGIGSYGVAYVLAGTSTNAATSGSGYAIVLGQSGGTDPIRLASFNNGLQGTLTNIITSNTVGLTDFGTEYLSIRVTYTPCSNVWELFVRNDVASFADPASGTLISQGTAVNNDFTSTAGMRYTGGYWQGSSAGSQTAFFDNLYLKTSPFVSAPTFTASTTNLNCLNYVTGFGPSFSRSYNINGCFLTPASGNISINAPANFQISSDNITFSNSINIPYTGSSLPITPVYVRLAAGLSAGAYGTSNITHSGGGIAAAVNVSLNGNVITETPVSTLQKGDLAVVSVNANNFSCSGVSTQDEISILLLKPIATGIAIDLTDNGWERLNANQWGNSEGIVRFTRTGGPLPSGTIITIRCGGNLPPSVISPDNGWQIDNINTPITFPDFGLNLNSGGDQLYIMQGGTWDIGTYVVTDPGPPEIRTYSHNATYTGGNVLFGFNTGTTWTAANNSQNSNLYPGIRCFSMMPGVATDFIKYTGLLTDVTQRTWIDRINTPANWTSYGSCTALNAASLLINLTVSVFVEVPSIKYPAFSAVILA